MIFAGLALQGRPRPAGSRDPQAFSGQTARLPLPRHWSLKAGERPEARPAGKLLSELRQQRRVPRGQQQGNGERRTHPTEIPKLRQLSKYQTQARHWREHLDILERSMNLWSEAWVPAPSHSLPTNNHATEEQVTWLGGGEAWTPKLQSPQEDLKDP